MLAVTAHHSRSEYPEDRKICARCGSSSAREEGEGEGEGVGYGLAHKSPANQIVNGRTPTQWLEKHAAPRFTSMPMQLNRKLAASIQRNHISSSQAGTAGLQRHASPSPCNIQFQYMIKKYRTRFPAAEIHENAPCHLPLVTDRDRFH